MLDQLLYEAFYVLGGSLNQVRQDTVGANNMVVRLQYTVMVVQLYRAQGQ